MVQVIIIIHTYICTYILCIYMHISQVLFTLMCVDKEVFPSASKSLFVQFKRINQASEAVTDIVILSTVNKAKVPQGYKRLP